MSEILHTKSSLTTGHNAILSQIEILGAVISTVNAVTFNVFQTFHRASVTVMVQLL